MTMPAKKRLTTIVSSKGRLVLPRTIRQALGWGAGVRLVVEDTSEGVLLKPEPTFVPTRPEEVLAVWPVTLHPGPSPRWTPESWRRRRPGNRNEGN